MAYASKFTFLTLLCVLFSNPCYSETDTLHQGQELKDWDELISSNNVFCLKFFSFGTMVNPYLGVFYRNNQIKSYNPDELKLLFRLNRINYPYNLDDSRERAPKDAVWVANRNNPIRDIYGKLIVDVNGKLSILSSAGTVLDLFSPTPLATRNASVTLLGSGNLVLRELHPDGSVKRVLWQSFDYPTDTLLPGMKLGINLKTGHRWSLTSWRNDELPAQGLFTLDLNGTGQMVILRQGNAHWASGPWRNGEFENTHLQSSGQDVRFDYVSNEAEQSFTYLTRTYDSYPALKIHQDGQLKGSPLKLNIHCRFINDPPGCVEDELENVKCRKHYRIRQGYDYYYYSLLDEYVYDETYNLYDCQRICWSNCSCVAYATTRNRVGCKTFGKRVDETQAYRRNRQDTAEQHNEYYTIDYYGEVKTEKKEKNWIGLTILIGLIIMIILSAVLLSSYWVYKNIDLKEITKKIKKLLLHQMRRMRRFYIYLRTDKNVNTELHYFTFQSISSATNNFSSANTLGKGGFGEVYKGKLVDGQEVAVKRLSKTSGQGVIEFKNEIELIAKLQHTNLVRLLGCCIEKQEQILVYEYMPNSSLDFFLFDSTKKGKLDWNNRFVIIDGIAQGLLYLHRFSRLRIIHRDLKASNILLDDYLKPKISDFGMAKLFGINESEVNTSRVVGTRGYMPPEYLIDGIISTKIDVFGFGVLLLEIISSKMNHASYDVEHPLNLLGLAWELWNQGRGLELMDPVLEDTCTPKEVMTCIHVGLLCVQDLATDRPTMSEVVSMLTNENMHLPEPKRPAFFIERHVTEADTGIGGKLGHGSENGESVSILVSK
ncbi:G-type lectin S-receptor-like serine/threonine-protein kinase At1g67520 [Bidens hawaiensis]|uniref:G-type lectin S-receptor-like serine/threonine-protein kinase At1g67520 n=1 Tax=Bidens hawaiensis TaxID=980011 RepID=UPI00404B2366